MGLAQTGPVHAFTGLSRCTYGTAELHIRDRQVHIRDRVVYGIEHPMQCVDTYDKPLQQLE